MSAFPPQIIVECRAGSLAAANRFGASAAAGQLEMGWWKRIVTEVAEQDPFLTFYAAYYGSANMITGYRLYYMLEYAKASGLKQVILRTDGGFWIEEATRWLIESGVDQIHLDLGYVGRDLDAQPIFERIGRLETAKHGLGVTKPEVEVETTGEAESVVRERLAAHDRSVRVRTRDVRGAGGERVPCRHAFEPCAINWRGELVACRFDTRSEFVAGWIGEATIAGLWSGRHRDLRDRHHAGRFAELPPPCADCSYWE